MPLRIRTLSSAIVPLTSLVGISLTLACTGSVEMTPAGTTPTLIDTNGDGIPDTPAPPGSTVTDVNGDGVPDTATPMTPTTMTPDMTDPTMMPPTAGTAGAAAMDPNNPLPIVTPPVNVQPVVLCDEAADAPSLPTTFTRSCAACHSAFGHQSPAFPDLFSFAGSFDQFSTQVRNGGQVMPGFDVTSISDADLMEVFEFFTTTQPGETVACLPSGPVQLDCGGATLEFEPLFSVPTEVVPITFTREDGALITRGAGRVRGRHEKEGSFSEFHPHYFQDRTYGFIVEDFTPMGQQQINVTYLPLGVPDMDGNRQTNWRAWKIYGNGNVFYENKYMENGSTPPMEATSEYAAVQYYNQTYVPGERTMAVGEHFEFEFGIFFDPGSLTTSGSRNSYYTDTFRYKIGVGGLSPENRDLDIVTSPGPLPGAQTGGDTTIPWIYAEPELYFSQMALNVQHEHVQHFVQGRRLFHTHFTDGEHTENGNPAFTEMAGLAGPLMQTDNCDACHLHNGRGRPLEVGESLSESSSIVFKLYNSGDLGNQLQLAEGTASLASYTSSSVQFADGSSVELRKPNWQINAAGVGGFSARVARKLIGLGLLEAVPEETILSRACADQSAPGISGRAMLVTDPETGTTRIGKIGWKAEKVSVRHQVADALDADIGVQTSIIPGATGAELGDENLDDLVTYMRLLGVPPRRDIEDPQVQRGEQIFGTIGCANCHIPTLSTGPNHPFVELRNQVIHPFSDVLLHDMGPDLADDSGTEFASEWRTPPLWGLGLEETVGGATGFLHDGRARTPLEAVLWHGGEAQQVRDNVLQLSAADRDALHAFLLSL